MRTVITITNTNDIDTRTNNYPVIHVIPTQVHAANSSQYMHSQTAIDSLAQLSFMNCVCITLHTSELCAHVVAASGSPLRPCLLQAT